MQARHRLPPGNGVRSNAIGIGGLSSATRISPDASFRPHGLYNSDYRNNNYNRGGFRRAPPKPITPSLHPPPPRRATDADIFMEAGRLAAEYLVSQGVLPPNLLQGNLQNNTLKNQSSPEFQECRLQDRENLEMPSDGRTSALSRLGNVVSDGRRRFADEFNPTGLRNHARGKTRMVESFPGYVPELGRENGKSSSWAEKPRTFLDIEGQDDSTSKPNAAPSNFSDGSDEILKVVSNELPSKCDTSGNSESELQNYEFPDETGRNATTSTITKQLPLEADHEFSKVSDDMKNLNHEELKACTNNDEMEKQSPVENFFMQHPSVEGDSVGNDGNDSLQLSTFGKAPTKAPSSLTIKDSKAEPVPTVDERNTCEISPSQEQKVSIGQPPVECSSNDIVAHQIHGTKSFNSGISGTQSIQSGEDVAVLESAYTVERGKCTMSESLPDGSIIYENASGQGFSELDKCSSMKDKGEKRPLESHGVWEKSKKPRDMLSSMVGPGEYFHQHNYSGNLSHSHDEVTAPDDDVVEVTQEGRLLNVAFFSRGVAESGIEFREEKQLFPSSFKICDLNLMEASDMTESHDCDPVLSLPLPEAKKEESVDVDLTISNNCNRSDDYEKSSIDCREGMVIEVEDDFPEEDKMFDTSERKTETVHSSLENFPNHMESTGDLPDAQDGYGLMISELLGNDISNCSPVPADITALPSDMGLHDGTAILGDDDPIYLSLGEIPISMPDI